MFDTIITVFSLNNLISFTCHTRYHWRILWMHSKKSSYRKTYPQIQTFRKPCYRKRYNSSHNWPGCYCTFHSLFFTWDKGQFLHVSAWLSLNWIDNTVQHSRFKVFDISQTSFFLFPPKIISNNSKKIFHMVWESDLGGNNSR